MATNLDIPEHFETWIGGSHGLRLIRHPQLAGALSYLDEFPMVMRTARVLESSRLRRDQPPQMLIETLPAFRNSSVGLTVELRVEIDYPRTDGGTRFARLRLHTETVELRENLILKPGKRQVITFPFPHFERRVLMRAELEVRDECGIETAVTLQPEKQWTWYVAFQTHLDVGWTDRVEKVISALRRTTSEDAVRVCRQFADNPPGRRFVWTCECSEALRYAWEGSDHRQRRDLLKYIELGLIQSCVMPFSFHSSIMSRDLMRRAIQWSFALRKEIGAEDILDLSVAQQTDVPGHNWVLPDLLSEAGVTRAVLGHNGMMRGCLLPPLFRWRGPDGGEVLTLATACANYGTPSGLPQNPEDLRGLSLNSTEGVNQTGSALFSTVVYGENCGPAHAEREIRSIQAWQERFVWPRIVIGGPKDYFDHLQREIDVNELPVVDKEISDWWVDGPASMPRAMAQYRRAMAQMPNVPMNSVMEKNLILFAEHTFGLNAQLVRTKAASQNWSIESGFENYVGSWEDKEAYADAAWREMNHLQRGAPARSRKEDRGTRTAGTADESWRIEWDSAGISRLRDPSGHVWVDARQTPEWPRFGSVLQRLLPIEPDSWFHHDAPAAPHAGIRCAEVIQVDGTGHQAATVLQRLESPAGAIRSIRFTLCCVPGTNHLRGELRLIGKEPTAQSELLVLSLPLSLHEPRYAGEVGGRLLRVDKDQLSDSNRDAHSFGDGWVVENHDASSRVAVSSPDVFLWHLGGLRYCDFNRSNLPRTGEVYAHLFNNVWETNFRAWIGGDLTYQFYLRPLKTDEEPLASLRAMTQLW